MSAFTTYVYQNGLQSLWRNTTDSAGNITTHYTRPEYVYVYDDWNEARDDAIALHAATGLSWDVGTSNPIKRHQGPPRTDWPEWMRPVRGGYHINKS